MGTDQSGYVQGQEEQGERRILVRVLLISVPLFVALWCLVPGVGPVFRLFSVPATSMAPTLRLGSTIVVSRASYGYSRHSFNLLELPIEGRIPSFAPARGDVVVFRLPSDHTTFFVCRVVGLPGDRVQMQEGQLILNGKLVPREAAGSEPDPFGEKVEVPVYVERLPEGVSYRIMEASGDAGYLDNTAELEVPPGHLFMLGDNRDNASDSRVPSTGTVPIELVLGRVVASL